MENKEAEKPVESKEFLKPATSRHTDEIIEAIDSMSLEDLQKADAGLKLLIAQYKEKGDENRLLQDKINALNIKNSDLSNKLAVARERLNHIGGKGLATGFLNIIAGAILAFVTTLPDTGTRTILFWLAIFIFVVCTIHNFRSDSQQKDIQEKER